MKKIPLFIALDLKSKTEALDWVQKTKDYVQGYKIGPRLFLPYGPELIQEIKNVSGAQVFLDFKFYDIPSSTVEAVRSSFQTGADFVTVHAQVGEKTLDLLSSLEKDIQQERFFQILFVTALSSNEDFEESRKQTLNLAHQVYQRGLRGLICSPWEASILRQKYPDMFLVTPGIRLKGDSPDDQKRFMTPKQAFQEKSSALVMGRSLIRSQNMVQELKKIQLSISAHEKTN